MLGSAKITVYRDETPGIDKNRHSIVLKIVFGERSLLLMADAGGQTQEYFLQCVRSQRIQGRRAQVPPPRVYGE